VRSSPTFRALGSCLDDIDEWMMNELATLDVLHDSADPFERAVQVWVARDCLCRTTAAWKRR
jgi:hypothetical protein